MDLFDDSRATWSAARSTNPRPVSPAARVGVSWHYPGGALAITPSSPHAACLAQVRSWQRAHQAKGWADIGYNLLVCQHARVIEGRGADFQGSHSPGVNAEHYGVQFMTSGDQAPTPAMYARAVTLRAALEARSGRTLRQWGHQDDPQASTECPGPAIEAWVRAGGPRKTTTTTEETDDMFTDSDRATLARLERALTSHDTEEDGRYQVETARYQHLAGLIKGVQSGDPQAIADAIPADLAAQVVDALGARLAPPPASS